MLVNPAKRRKSKSKRRKSPIAKRVVSSVKRRVKKYRCNPISGSSSGIMNQVKNAAVGAAGALAVDVVMSKLPLPLAMQTGAGRSAAQGLVSLGLGYAVAKFGKNRSLGVQLAEGGLTIALHGVFKGAVQKAMPTLALGEYDDDGLMGEGLLGNDLLGMGYISPAQVYDNVDDAMGYMDNDY